MSLPEHGDHGRSPLGLLGHDQRLHDVPVGRQPDVGVVGRRRQGRQVAGRHRCRQELRRRRGGQADARAPWATSSRPTRWRTASPTPRSRTRPGTYVLPTISNTSAAADGVTVPADLGISTINSPNPQAYPIVSQTFLVAYKDPCKSGGASSATASGLKKFLTLRVRRRPEDARLGLEPAARTRRCRPRWRPRTPRSWHDDLQRIADLVGGRLGGGKRHHGQPAAARHLERSPVSRLPDRLLQVGADRAGGG